MVFPETLVRLRLSKHARLLCPPVPPPRGLGALLRLVHEGRPSLHPSDCFETFPFPENWETHPRSRPPARPTTSSAPTLMVRNDEGLTKTYNRFHDPDERDADIVKLRELHAAMDRAVLDAYGWTTSPTRLRVPPRLRDRRGGVGRQEEALALPLARRRPRRGARAPPRAERRAREGGSALRRRAGKTAGRKRATKRASAGPRQRGTCFS